MILDKGLQTIDSYRLNDANNVKVVYDNNIDLSFRKLLESLDHIILNAGFHFSVVHYSRAIEEHLSYLNNVLSKDLFFVKEGVLHKGDAVFDTFKAEYMLSYYSSLAESTKAIATYVFEIVELITTRGIGEALIYARRRARTFSKRVRGLSGRTFVCIINGSNQVGKDTFIDLFKQGSTESVHNISTVDKVKEAAAILGWDGIKTDENREALHQLKLLGTRFFDHSVRYVREFVRKHTGTVIFVHCREPEEIKRLVEEVTKVDSGVFCRTLLIKNSRVEPATNAADQNVLNYEYDDTIWNNSTIEEYMIAARKYYSTFIY